MGKMCPQRHKERIEKKNCKKCKYYNRKKKFCQLKILEEPDYYN